MRTFRALEPVTAVLMGVLLIALLLAAAAFFFVGVINAEDWFFGTKLDGPRHSCTSLSWLWGHPRSYTRSFCTPGSSGRRGC